METPFSYNSMHRRWKTPNNAKATLLALVHASCCYVFPCILSALLWIIKRDTGARCVMHICALLFFPVELSTVHSLRARSKWVEISLHRPHVSGCGRGEDLLSGQVYRRPERAVPGPALSHRRLQSASFWKKMTRVYYFASYALFWSCGASKTIGRIFIVQDSDWISLIA